MPSEEKTTIEIDRPYFRIDMFIARFKVAEFMHGTTMNVFYEQFVADNGEHDETVQAYAEELVDFD